MSEDENQDKTRIYSEKDKVDQAGSDDATRFDVARIKNATGDHSVDEKTRVSSVVSTSEPTKIIDDKPKTVAKQDRTRSVDHRTEMADHRRTGRGRRIQAQDTLKNRFVLGRVLGAGGMGVVYKAKDLLKVEAKDRDPFVAIKVLGEEFKSHPEAFIALQRESRKTQRIAHPNIVNVHDFDKDGDTVFMTMEFLEGTPLDKLIKKHKNVGLPKEEAWTILDGICAALGYAHDQKIIHSDLKPGNIFVTNNHLAKVFDFGIARAVAKAEQGGVGQEQEQEDKTIFDAANLGALTPAYASLEMLEGESPDVRDDIYALGCIAYELFTGKHPYQRKNALDAKNLGLKLQRIPDISKKQWKVIESALSFERELRTPSVEEFWSGLTEIKASSISTWVAVVTLLLGMAGVGFYVMNSTQDNTGPAVSSEFLEQEAEVRVRIEIAEQSLNALLNNPLWDERWEAELWKILLDYSELVGKEDERLAHFNGSAFALYEAKIPSEIAAEEYKSALIHIENARKYQVNNALLDALLSDIRSAQEQAKLLSAQAAEQRRKEAAAKKEEEKQQAVERKKREARTLALANINEQIACQKMLDMEDFKIAVDQLKKVDAAYFRRSEGEIVSGLAACIQKIGRNFPERAERARKQALRLFADSSVLRSIDIAKRDPCDISLAGQGARGKRSACRDELKTGSRGPELVVIPANSGGKAFAIGKYEVSVAEINEFCKASGRCKPLSESNISLPASNISYSLVQAYVRWITEETGKKYRLPTMEEWMHAAKASGSGEDPNRNCLLNSRGIQKGGTPVSADTGQQNAWGIVNHVGNVAEWIAARGNSYWAMGGSYNTNMDECNTRTRQASSDGGSVETGFRVLRELASDD